MLFDVGLYLGVLSLWSWAARHYMAVAGRYRMAYVLRVDGEFLAELSVCLLCCGIIVVMRKEIVSRWVRQT
jgi:hypothetical protein